MAGMPHAQSASAVVRLALCPVAPFLGADRAFPLVPSRKVPDHRPATSQACSQQAVGGNASRAGMSGSCRFSEPIGNSSRRRTHAVGIRPKRKDDWLVVPNLWGGVIGPPSKKKTPALSEMLKALHRLEKSANDDAQHAKASAADPETKIKHKLLTQ